MSRARIWRSSRRVIRPHLRGRPPRVFWIARGRRPLPPVRWNSRSSCLTRWRSCWAFPARAAHGSPRPAIASRFRRIQLRHIAHASDTRADVVRGPCTAPPLHASASATRARLRRSNAASPRHSGAQLPDKLHTCTHARAQCHCQGRSPNGYYCAGGRPSTMNERVVATACLTGLILSYSGELYHASALSTLGNSRIETRLAGGAPSMLSVRPPAAR
jgi:hypothetical protein